MLYVLRREFIYIWYYFELQLRQILPYWLLGILIGSIVSVFVGDKIHRLVQSLSNQKLGVLGVVPASILGIASPLCMYGTIPLAASFSKSGIRDDWLAAFMMSSILLNPQLIVYSTALGTTALTVRIVSCLLCGIAAGILVHLFCQNTSFFDFSGFAERKSRDTHPNLFIRLLKNIGRNFKATGPWFLFGVLLASLFQRYVPAHNFAQLFGSNEGFGILMSATIGVPLYACGGGTIPLLQQWLWNGMSMGSAAAFMITGPATKITNLGALKIVLGIKGFILYMGFVMAFSLLCGEIVDFLSSEAALAPGG
ncbi:MAG TPA: permease [Candidatus Agathobaculum pullicola]|nr:permease [Candidatus Agathobaculum pullicola]